MRTLRLLAFVLALAFFCRILGGCGGSNRGVVPTNEGAADYATTHLSLLASNSKNLTVSTQGAVEGFVYKTAQHAHDPI